MLTQSIIKKEFALSGSEQNPDLTGKSWLMTARRATNKGAPGPVEAFKTHGADFVVRDNLADLVAGMNALAGGNLLKLEHLQAQIEARDREIANRYVKDTQVMNIHNARRYIGDRLIRTAAPHRILDPAHGPLIAVKLNILTRKTLGGFETDLDSRVFGRDGNDHAGTLRRRRGGRLWRRRHARLPVAGRHLPRRLPVLGPQCRAGGGKGRRLTVWEGLLTRPDPRGTYLPQCHPMEQRYNVPGYSEISMRYAQAPPTIPIKPADTDAELVRRAGARDEAAVRSIMQANNRRLYRIARGILRNDAEAEDVVQETYVRAFTHLDSFRGDFEPRYLACPHRHERGAGPVAPAAAECRSGHAGSGRCRSPDHPVSPLGRIRRSGKIDGTT